jgi:hypothetical protein
MSSEEETEEDQRPQRRPRPQYYFQITSLPESDAPMAYRKALVGKVFRLMPRNMDGPEPMAAIEVESGLPVDIADGVCTELHYLVSVLRSAGEERAADYWEARGFDSIVFLRSEVRIVSPHQLPE